MSLIRLVVQELLHRKLGTLLGILAVTVAAGCLIGSVMLLNAFDLDTERLVHQKQKEVEAQMKKMNDEYTKITKKMGFNVLVLPKDQNLNNFYAENYADKFMPESYAKTLVSARSIATIRHLLPMLQMKTEWPEQGRKILLIGVRGEMPWAHRDNKKPIVKAVPEGTVTIGYELARSMKLKKGSEIVFHGRKLKVGTIQPERGSIDDITLWIDLALAQEIMGKKGLINSMMALECKCAWANLAKIRKDIQAILPNTQVIEIAGKAIARAEARVTAEKNAKKVVEREKKARTALRRQREKLMGFIVPVAVGGAAVWICILSLINVRERRTEVGILRALGLGARHILGVFLAKAAVIGLIGAAVGVAVGIAIGAGFADMDSTIPWVKAIPDAKRMAAVVLGSPVLAAVAAWWPALLAAIQDPADVLREE